MERVTAHQTTHPEPAASEEAVPRDRLERVLRAARRETTTCRKRRRNKALVPANYGHCTAPGQLDKPYHVTKPLPASWPARHAAR
jgi:hypothetical protein